MSQPAQPAASKNHTIARRRGAPIGNTNAIKHGFYARKFKPTDLTGIDDFEFSGLDEEITMLRIYIRRVIEMGADVQDLPRAMALLRVFSLATISLTRLIRTQHIISPDPDNISQWLSVAINQATSELFVDPDSDEPDSYQPLDV
ncbi:MAG: hypothetical protein MUO76_22730 [Anaerolineaceae bacterium]|nr:hypothetical protein [Anaerolineaceae bacterium]